jgi:hypothetical protein
VDEDNLATSLDGGIAARVMHSAEESQRGHNEQATQLLNETDEIANKARPFFLCRAFLCDNVKLNSNSAVVSNLTFPLTCICR